MTHDAASAVETAAAAERERILVCDDDPRMRDTIVEALAKEPFDVDTADRAVDAIQRIMHTSYRALILDLKLPGLGGLDAIAVVKRFDELLPIIVMMAVVGGLVVLTQGSAVAPFIYTIF